MLYEVLSMSFLLMLPYLLCSIWNFYRAKWHYAHQERVLVNQWVMPVLGSVVSVLWSQVTTKRRGDNFHPTMRVVRDELKRMPDAAAFVAFKSNDAVVWLLDVKVVQDLYTT